MSETRRIITFITVSLITMSVCRGQSRSIGATFSFSGIALTYEYDTDPSSFIDIVLKAECGGMFFGNGGYPGATASFTWNMVFARKESVNGNEIRFYAGPGVLTGWSNDLMKPHGIVFGLKGRIGTECSFGRGVTLSASLCPVIGTHMQIMDDYLDLRWYRMGVLSAILPEIGIRYRF